MNKIFKQEYNWSDDKKSNIGLPRPSYSISKEYKNIFKAKGTIIATKNPIPWQSKPSKKDTHFLDLIQENEDKVFADDLCAFCGIKIADEEKVIRWKTYDIRLIDNGEGVDEYFGKTRAFVFSDIHPFHIECMRQGRMFCPFMRSLKDKDFEIGKYVILKENAVLDRTNKKNG